MNEAETRAELIDRILAAVGPAYSFWLVAKPLQSGPHLLSDHGNGCSLSSAG